MRTHNFRSIQGVLTGWLIAAALTITACSNWAGPDRAYRLARSDMDLFKNSVRYQQSDAGYHYRLGRYFQQRGRHMLAVAEFRRTINLDPHRADAHNAMGVSYDELRHFDLAEGCYGRALIVKPDFAAAYNNLGYSYLMQGNPEKAIAPLQKAVSLHDSNARFHNNLALAYRQSGQVETASVEFKSSGQDQPGQSLEPESSSGVPVNRAKELHLYKIAWENENPPWFSDSSNRPETMPLADPPRQSDSPSPQPVANENTSSRAMRDNTGVMPPWAPSQIEIANGNGVHQMARNIGNYFKQKGFDVHRLSNADHFNYPRTRIFYSDGQRQVACTLSQMLFGPDMVCDLIYNGQKYGQIKILMGDDVAGLNDLFSGKLQIQVANGNGVRDMAGKLSSYLRTKGFYVARPVNAGHFGYESTRIYYPAGRLTNARFVGRELPESDTERLIEDDRQSDTIYIIIGQDFTL
ncbi:MAG: LytR C-terminal domain-containing protein [Desulfobacterales bacterium]